jgi:hypothetical protein
MILVAYLIAFAGLVAMGIQHADYDDTLENHEAEARRIDR